MKREIDVIVQENGEVTLEANGFKGSGCLRATQFLEQALGLKTSQKLKADIHVSSKAESRLEVKK